MKKGALVLIVIAVLLIAVLLYWNQSVSQKPNPDRDLVCDSLTSEEAQDSCCAEINIDTITVKCVGNWEYVNGLKQCQFVCSGFLPACTEEAKLCPNRASVVRNASNECEFDACSTIYTNQADCENAGGAWGIFGNAPNGPIYSCGTLSSDAGKPCSDNSQCNYFCVAPPNSILGSETNGTCSRYSYDCDSYRIQQGTVTSAVCP